jgi:hypothetical protein
LAKWHANQYPHDRIFIAILGKTAMHKNRWAYVGQRTRHTKSCRPNGEKYESLSKVASAITGTKWNGPCFFGLRDKTLVEVTA